MKKGRTKKAHSNESKTTVKTEISKLINQIQAIDNRGLFLYDPVVQFPVIAEQYKKACPKRIWINKMKHRNQASEYARFSDWLADFELMIKNCLLFNANQPAYSKEAQRIYQEAITHIQAVQDRLGIPSPESTTLTGEDLSNKQGTPVSSPNVQAHEVPVSSPNVQAHEVPVSSPNVQAHEVPVSSPTAQTHEAPVSNPSAQAHETPVKATESNGVKIPYMLTDFLAVRDGEITASTDSVNSNAFPQFRRRYSVQAILCLFYIESKAKSQDGVKQDLEGMLRLFDKVADKLLFYEGEHELFTKISEKGANGSLTWSNNVGVDFFLRFAFHFRSIARAAGWLPEQINRYSDLLEKVLGFIEKYFPQISEEVKKTEE